MPPEPLQPNSSCPEQTADSETPSGGQPDTNRHRPKALGRIVYVCAQAGSAAFFVGIALAGAVVRLREPERQLAEIDAPGSAFSTLPDTTEALLWTLFQAHGVDITVRESSTAPETSAAIADAAIVDPSWLVVAVPLVLLAAGGAATAALAPQSLWGAAGTGAAITVAYAPLAALAVWLATYSPSTVTMAIEGDPGPGTAVFGDRWAVGFSIGPDPLAAVFVAGIAYPVVFGAVGGAAAHLKKQSRPESSQ